MLFNYSCYNSHPAIGMAADRARSFPSCRKTPPLSIGPSLTALNLTAGGPLQCRELQQEPDMSGNRFQKVALLLLACLAAAPASGAGPGSNFKHVADETSISPDGQVRIEQYVDKSSDDWVYQLWAFDSKRRGVLLNPGENADLAGYRAGFRFSPDSQWLVRMQKTGAGFHTLFLYRRSGHQFAAATAKPLGDLAWNYFYSQPVAREIKREAKDHFSLSHVQVHLIKAMETNYAALGQRWPPNRYIALSLNFDAQGEDTPLPWIKDWRCVYDLKTGAFSIPPAFAAHNVKTISLPDPARK